MTISEAEGLVERLRRTVPTVDWRGAVADKPSNPDGPEAATLITTLTKRVEELERALEWQPLETAPKDGTRILAWCVHPFANEAGDDDYQAPVVAQWINHNGGGWTWHGLCGRFTYWRPLPEPPARTTLQDRKG